MELDLTSARVDCSARRIPVEVTAVGGGSKVSLIVAVITWSITWSIARQSLQFVLATPKPFSA